MGAEYRMGTTHIHTKSKHTELVLEMHGEDVGYNYVNAKYIVKVSNKIEEHVHAKYVTKFCKGRVVTMEVCNGGRRKNGRMQWRQQKGGTMEVKYQ